jgi:alpha-beta hydrolase superfamily lysophospholipase
VVHHEFELKPDHRQGLFAQTWAPEGAPRGAVALVHGFGEHTGRYGHVGASLAHAAYAVCGVDLPGHGRTKGKQGRSSGIEALETIGRLVGETKRRFPGAPVFLYGHSWGGALAMRYAMSGSTGLAGVIATSPLIRLARPAPGWKLAAARLLCRVLPSVMLSNPLDRAELTRDARAVEAVRGDPLYHNKASARLGWDIIQNGHWLDGQTGFPVPLLVMQGTADKIVDAAAAAALARRLTGDVTLKTWEGLFHELHNEPERHEVISHVVEWMGRYAA